MVDLKIEQNERIIRRTNEAWSFDGDEERELQSLVLTNKHLISVYEKSGTLFFKRETVVDKKPLSLISIIDDVLQVKNIMDDNFGESLQILYDNGIEELYFFGDAPKSEYQQWKIAITKAVVDCKEKNSAGDSNKTFIQNASSVETNTTIFYNDKGVVFCSSCGIKLDSDARFCKSCGNPIEQISQSIPSKVNSNSLENRKPSKEPIIERKIVYEGNLHKCPNCGETLESFVTNCPSCGHEIRETKSSTSIREFVAKLEEIEKNRTTTEDVDQLSKTDMQKINLIRNFAVPNTKEDLLEFLTLAASNINVTYGSLSESQEAISYAWEAKFEQIYKKAIIILCNNPEIREIKKIYDIKSEKISKKNESVSRNKKVEHTILNAIPIIYILIGLGAMGWILWTNVSDRQGVKAENARLEQITQEIYQAVESENYNKAHMMIVTLVYSGPSSKAGLEAKEYWGNVQKEMLDLLEREEEKIQNSSTEYPEQMDNTNSH